MLFRYSGFDSNGLKVKSKLEASNLEEAKAKLKAKSILHTSLEEENFSLSKFSFKRRKSISLANLSYLSRDLSIYLNSGISLIQSIDLLKQRYKKEKVLGSFFESVATYLDEGKTFYLALDSQNVLKLPEFYKQSIKISENGGLLESVLMELSTFLKEQDRIKKQVGSALAYPLFILFISFFMVGFMLSFIVPKITGIFTQINQELPASTKISILIFSIIIVFLYKTLDQTKYSNTLFTKKQEILKESNHLHNIFLEDVAEASNITITLDKNKNAIVKIVTYNTYHNAFFNNVTYLINSSKKLIRMQSQSVFDEVQPIEDAFLNNAFIDVLLEDIEYFDLKNSENNYIFAIKQKNKDRVFYNTYKIRDHNIK